MNYRWLIYTIPFLILFGMIRLYYFLTDDFRVSNIIYDFPLAAHWQVPLLTSEEHSDLAQILSQPFRYIGKGAQCYAFASDDGKYVIKFFKFKHLKPNWFINYLPSFSSIEKYRKQTIARKNRKLIGVFNGYDLAYRENRANSQLIYLHLKPTQFLHLHVTVFDKIGWRREISLDDVVFLIQRKGETLRSRLHELFQKKDLEKAKESLSQIFEMYVSEYKNGLYDHDHGVMQNTGFVDDRPFHLDVGKLHKDDRIRDVEKYKLDLQFVMLKIGMWIRRSYPQSEAEMVSFLVDSYERWTGEKENFMDRDPRFFKNNLL